MEEPDRVEFEHAGFPCLLVRGPSGGWCGYVGLPPGHRYYEHHYDTPDVRVHGGLTYSHHCQGSICHVVPEGEADHRWWLGFDCNHCGDWSPIHNFAMWKELMKEEFCQMPGQVAGEYRDVAYVRAEVESLAEQLK